MLIKPHIHFLYNFGLKCSGNKYDAEDLVQETLFIALKKINQLRDDKKSKSWVFSILRNVFLKELRNKSKLKTLETNDSTSIDYLQSLGRHAETTDIEKVFELKQDETEMQEILNKLPEKYKSPIILYFMEDMPYKEIAEFLDIPTGTVMSRLSRGKLLMKTEILRRINYSDSAKIIDMAGYKNIIPQVGEKS